MNRARTRKERILELLLANKGRRVPSPELARISLQYGSRVLELRADGYIIQNEIERVGGDVHGYFTLVSEPDISTQASQPTVSADVSTPLLFADQPSSSSMLAYETGQRGVR